MDPNLKSKLIKLVVGALVAGAIAALTYFTTGLQGIFSGVPLGIAVGYSAAVVISFI